MSGKKTQNSDETQNQDTMPDLAQAFSAFSKSADKLGALYGKLAATACEQLPQDLEFGSNANMLLFGVLECISDGVILVDHNMNIAAANTVAQELMKQNNDFVDEFYSEVFAETLITATPRYYQKRLPSNSEIHIRTTPIIDDNRNAIGVVGILGHVESGIKGNTDFQQYFMDPSQHNSLTSTLTAVGDTIINIANRIRSPLSAIQLFAEILKQDLDTDKQETVDNILVGVHSLEAILSNLLSFAQPVKSYFKRVNLIEILDESLSFANPAIKQQSISLLKDYSHTELYCRGDLEQLRQVCFNLILNAIQAMPGGGELIIRVSYVSDSNTERDVYVEIEDTGCGIPDEEMGRIFTPFFTTKEGGTGLGLCVVYKIIQAHQGNIQIKSSNQNGTIVSVQFPAG